MNFNIDDFIVHILLSDNKNLEIKNSSKYNCRIHFENEKYVKYSLLCYAKTTRHYFIKLEKIIFTKGPPIINKKMRLPLTDLQFYFEDDEIFDKFQKWKFYFDETKIDNNILKEKTNNEDQNSNEMEKNIDNKNEENKNRSKRNDQNKNYMDIKDIDKNLKTINIRNISKIENDEILKFELKKWK